MNLKGESKSMAKEKVLRPAFEQRFNHIRLSVWENQNKGQSWFNVVITRRFKDGDEWKESSSFSGLGDLALVSAAVRSAEKFLMDKSFDDAAGSDESEAIAGV